jgi:hypothetical protein
MRLLLILMITTAAVVPASAQARRPGDQEQTVAANGDTLSAEDTWANGTGPSTPNSVGVAGNPNRRERYETRPSGADFPQGTAGPTENSGRDPNAHLEPAPMNR